MKKLHICQSSDYWPEKQPSKVFLHKLSQALTEKISALIESPSQRACFTQILELGFEDFYHCYDISKPSILTMKIRAKNQALVLVTFPVVWQPKLDKNQILYPWDDVSEIDITFRFNLPIYAVRKLNEFLPLLCSPIVTSEESSLPYDYHLKNQTTDGRLVFYPINQFDSQTCAEIENTLRTFFLSCSFEENEKIHYIGELKMQKNGCLFVVIDFGSCSRNTIVDCISSFRQITGLKKIVYR